MWNPFRIWIFSHSVRSNPSFSLFDSRFCLLACATLSHVPEICHTCPHTPLLSTCLGICAKRTIAFVSVRLFCFWHRCSNPDFRFSISLSFSSSDKFSVNPRTIARDSRPWMLNWLCVRLVVIISLFSKNEKKVFIRFSVCPRRPEYKKPIYFPFREVAWPEFRFWIYYSIHSGNVRCIPSRYVAHFCHLSKLWGGYSWCYYFCVTFVLGISVREHKCMLFWLHVVSSYPSGSDWDVWETMIRLD